jgi:hypothetical protein
MTTSDCCIHSQLDNGLLYCPQMEDYSAWLSQAATEGDDVVVTMDLGAGREFALLSRMVRDGTIALVDKLYIRWHYQISVRCSLHVHASRMSIPKTGASMSRPRGFPRMEGSPGSATLRRLKPVCVAVQNWHWVALFEYVFSIFGISVEYLSEVQTV